MSKKLYLRSVPALMLAFYHRTSVHSFAPINKSLHDQKGTSHDNSCEVSTSSLGIKCSANSNSMGYDFSTGTDTPSSVAEKIETSMRVQREIETEETDNYRQLGDNSVVLLAVRTATNDAGCGCEGYLSQESTARNVYNSFKAHIDLVHGPDGSLDLFAAVFHKLLLRYLSIEQEMYEEDRSSSEGDQGTKTSYRKPTLDISFGEELDSLDQELGCIGISMNEVCDERDLDIPDPISCGLGIQLGKFIPFVNEFAFRHRGTEQGNVSLEVLRMLSARRVRFNFSKQGNLNYSKENQVESNVVSLQKEVLSSSTVEDVMAIMEEIKSRKWLSTNPDSVDGLPSLHLNLITNGVPLFQEGEKDDGKFDKEITFSSCISRMTDILRPRLYDVLLPAVREMTNRQNVEILDVFIRNYGKMDMGDNNEESDAEDDIRKIRFGLSPHYDVTAYATCVMALDSTAANGKSGLYIIPPANGISSSNAAHKKFIPLQRGDGIVHTYDILHGVDVDPELSRPRTSLIVWFVDRGDDYGTRSGNGDDEVNQPWLLNPKDDIGEFILGLASESNIEEDGSHLNLKNAINPLDLYIASASKGNIFAITTLGQLCDDEMLPETDIEKVRNILDAIDPSNPFLSACNSIDEGANTKFKSRMPGYSDCKSLASALWYYASIKGGNRVAQVSLADELMLQFMMLKDDISPKEQEDILLMASTLFTMALNQGYDSTDSLRRMMDVECRRLQGLGLEIPSEEFFSQPVVQVILMSL